MAKIIKIHGAEQRLHQAIKKALLEFHQSGIVEELEKSCESKWFDLSLKYKISGDEISQICGAQISTMSNDPNLKKSARYFEKAPRICKGCHRSISHKHPNAKFHSQRCKDEYWNLINPRGYGKDA